MTAAPHTPLLSFGTIEEAIGAIRARGMRLSTTRRLLLEALFAAEDPGSHASTPPRRSPPRPPRDPASRSATATTPPNDDRLLREVHRRAADPLERVRETRPGRPRHQRVRRQHHGPAARLLIKSHDEAQSGQQELYVPLRGSGTVDVDGARLPLDPDYLVRVDAGTARVLSSGPDALRVLCIGRVPGGIYAPPDWSSAGE